MADDIYRNKKDFGREEFSTEMTNNPALMRTMVSPREAKSQKAQYTSGGRPGLRNDVKINMKFKVTAKHSHGQHIHHTPDNMK